MIHWNYLLILHSLPSSPLFCKELGKQCRSLLTFHVVFSEGAKGIKKSTRRWGKTTLFNCVSLAWTQDFLGLPFLLSSNFSCGSSHSEEWVFLPMCVLDASKDSYLFPPMSPCVQSGLWHWWWLCHLFCSGGFGTSAELMHIFFVTLAYIPYCKCFISLTACLLCQTRMPKPRLLFVLFFCVVWWAFIHLPSSSLFSWTPDVLSSQVSLKRIVRGTGGGGRVNVNLF